MAERYDTMVIRGAAGKSVPREVDGGEVVSWSKGHALASMDALEEFVQYLADGDCDVPKAVTERANEVLSLVQRRRDLGWSADEVENSNQDCGGVPHG